jgi:hypothetical protein
MRWRRVGGYKGGWFVAPASPEYRASSVGDWIQSPALAAPGRKGRRAERFPRPPSGEADRAAAASISALTGKIIADKSGGKAWLSP